MVFFYVLNLAVEYCYFFLSSVQRDCFIKTEPILSYFRFKYKNIMELHENEKELLRKSPILWYKKKIQAVPGSLIVTNQRVVFEQHKIKPIGGLLGSLFTSASKKTRDEIIFSETLTSISVEKGKKINKKSFKAIFKSATSDSEMVLMVDDSLMAELEPLLKV